MSTYVYPNEFIYWNRYDGHKAIKDELQPLILENLEKTKDAVKDKWLCNLNTEFFDPSMDPSKYQKLVTEAVYPNLDQMFAETRILPPKRSQVTNIWYNYYEAGQQQELHTHAAANTTISGVYILHLEEQNQTVFYSQMASLGRFIEPVKRLVEAEEGCVILFPSHLLHYVLPCSKPRITVAFNIFCEL